jgi:hypothetical protein
MDDSHTSANSDNHVSERTGQFRVTHLLYIVTLICVSLGTFGEKGIFSGTMLGGFWAAAFINSYRRIGLLQAIGFCATFISLLAFCLYAMFFLPPQKGSRFICQLNLRQITFALQQYHLTYGSLPPAYVADAHGKPMHSWRVLILPFLDRDDLYAKYRFDEPWDGPNNRQLIDLMPSVYACPGQQGRSYTDFQAVIGPKTAWPGPIGRKMSEISDDSASTVLVVEFTDGKTIWTEPRDLAFDEAIRVLSSPDEIVRHGGHWYRGYVTERYLGHSVAMVDGFDYGLEGVASESRWSQLLTINDGTTLSDWQSGTPIPPTQHPGNIVRLAVWFIVVLWPTGFISIERRRSSRGGRNRVVDQTDHRSSATSLDGVDSENRL